ncbi:Beta-barrel assembly machine subunit BamA [Thiogranum longum]|uniref:Outer membrane protein assembly factor BamA n=1 Tax=Thiogranum longum TaxID=1537524 RepID=A0A4R1HGJ5_9GAMM|nr:outer membrane protein assembly factor BamA [Thiogranum longum]TCK18449.1 Beta-barrel assembly machine subunit BamA [Thiogranum longum]
MRLSLKPLVLGMMLASSAHAFEPFNVEDIRVEGLQRIAPGTVFNYLPVKVGDRFNTFESERAIRALFKSGYFRDISLERDGGILVVQVQERPAVASIKIQGNDDIETEPLLDSLEDIGLAEGRVFNRSLLEQVEQELERQYFSRGKYGVKIKTTVTPLERNRVGILIDVSEGVVARIKQINIVGNSVFDDETLLDQFEQRTPGWLTFYTKSDQYSRQKLAADLETLRSFYQDRGYIKFNVDSTQVSITPDKKDIYITINITEGEQYHVSDIKLSGDLVVPAEELFPEFRINAGDTFSRKKVTNTVTRLTDHLGNKGYAFANVNTIPEIDEETRQVSLTFFVDPGKRVYVRRINFAGNTKTRDQVMRQEMRQMEGGWFSSKKVERSRTRLQRLGYFSTVNVETPAVPGATDEVDVNYSIAEQPSGSISVGIGFSQTSGVLLNGSISQDNFMGTGRRVSASVNNSSVNRIFSFSYQNPYYTVDGVSRGFGAFYRETDASQANIANYSTDTYGANVTYGFPVNEYDTFNFDLKADSLKLRASDFSSAQITDFIDNFGDEFKSLTLVGSFSHDTRNRRVFPSSGGVQRISVETKVPGSELEYYKLNLRAQQYVPLTRLFILSTKLQIGWGDGFGDFDNLPFFQNFFAGGTRSVRGYRDNSLGPLDSSNDPLGGSFRTVGNLEVVFPPPFMADSKSVRLSLFYDVGNVFSSTQDFSAEELRMSAGLSAVWLSPVGPLSVSIAQAFNDQSGDDTQFFQFNLGAGF